MQGTHRTLVMPTVKFLTEISEQLSKVDKSD